MAAFFLNEEVMHCTRLKINIYIKVETGEMAQSVHWLLRKHENQSLDSQACVGARCYDASVIGSLERWRQKDPRCSWAVSPAKLGSSGFPFPKAKVKNDWGKGTSHWHLISTHTITPTKKKEKTYPISIKEKLLDSSQHSMAHAQTLTWEFSFS